MFDKVHKNRKLKEVENAKKKNQEKFLINGKLFNDGKMCVFIRKDAYQIACSFPHTSEEFRNLMKTHAGLWLDVDTETLFTDQFNVKFYTKETIRVPYMYIGTVRNDARWDKKLCLNCGSTSVYRDILGRIHPRCPHCQNGNRELMHLYYPDNTTNGVIC